MTEFFVNLLSTPGSYNFTLRKIESQSISGFPVHVKVSVVH